MKYTVYQIRNNVNGKVYIGTHKTKNVDDSYMGSGTILHRAYEKYGIENFEKSILHVFDSSAEMFDKEAELVNEEFIARKDTYNLRVGGLGGFDYLNENGLRTGFEDGKFTTEQIKEWSKKGIAKFSELLDDSKYRRKYSQMKREEAYERGFPTYFKGRRHSEETKAIMSEKAKKRLADPTKNSQYGTCWINNGIVAKKIKKTELSAFIDEGWQRGRKI